MNPVFVTGNKNKVHDLNRYLGYELKHESLDLDEIQDLDPIVVAKHKARQAYAILKKPVLIEDTSLIFNALGQLPGPFIKFFLEQIGSSGCCKILDNFDDRSGQASVTFVLYDGKNTRVFDGKLEGTIATQPRGSRGYGWDTIFIPAGQPKTFGQINENEYYARSVRGIAVKKLKLCLDKLQ